MTTTITRSPRPGHARTKSAKKARKAVSRYAAGRTASRSVVAFAAPAECWTNERVDPLSLTGGPLSLVKAMLHVGHSVAATVSTSVADGSYGVACVWVLSTDRRWLRASWHWNNGWKAHAAILDGVNVGVTAARKALV